MQYPIHETLGEKVTYRFLPHTGDIRVAIEAPTLESLYADATEIVRQLLVDGPVEERDHWQLAVNGLDAAEILLGFLRELLYRFDTDRIVPARVQIDTADATHLEGILYGERFDPTKHEAQPEVKAVTRHGLVVERHGDGWRAEVVFDV